MTAITAEHDLAAYLTDYAHAMAFGDEAPETIVDRYHTPDVEWWSDGIRFDRDTLVAHATPTRRNVTSLHVDVDEAVVAGDRAAARYTMRTTLRKGRDVALEVYLFARLAADGRLRRIDQVTRPLDERRPA